MNRNTGVSAFLAIFLAYLSLAAASAQAMAQVRTDTPSGYPVPRFVSLKSAETFCRAGPSFEHPVAITFLKAGAPVMVVAETVDHWRKIRDVEGAECWAHQTTLAALSHVLLLEEAVLLARPEPGAPARARLAAGVLAELEDAEGAWRRVKAGGHAGWVRADALWGGELHAAPHD